MRHLPIRELGYALGFIVLLAALYVGAFYALVEIEDRPTPVLSLLDSEERYLLIPVSYRAEGEFTRKLFDPMLKLDLRFRYPDRRAADGVLEKASPYYPAEFKEFGFEEFRY